MTREIDINGKVTVSIDSDSQEFADKVFAALSAIDRQQAVLLKNANKLPAQRYRLFSDANIAIRRQIDDLFGVSVCAPLFGEDSIYARSGGTPLWYNLLQSDKGQVKQLSLYSHTVFFAAFRRTLRATVHFGAHIRESGALIRSCARTHLSVLIWEHLLPKSSRSRSTVIVAPMSITFPSGVCTTG